jgi:hypothetical protein
VIDQEPLRFQLASAGFQGLIERQVGNFQDKLAGEQYAGTLTKDLPAALFTCNGVSRDFTRSM